jgi:hypothetical protein
MAELSSKPLSLFAFCDFMHYMKKYLLPGIIAVLTMTGCSEDFKIAAPYKDITVVDGILDRQDTAHYIRIQKAFLDESKSAIDMSKIPDSSFYDSLNVKMQEFSIEGKLISETPLNRVDLTTEGYPKNPAANNQGFFTVPSYAYKYKHQLDAFRKYKLVIFHNKSGRTDSSQLVQVVNSDTAKGNSNNFIINDFTKANLQIDFAKTTLASHEYILRGQSTPRGGYMLEGKIRFHYVDSNLVTGAGTRKSVDLYLPSEKPTYPETTPFILKIPNKTIYSFLRDAMGLPATNVARYFTVCEIFVYCGSAVLYNYQQIALAQSGGLTGDQVKPLYTNMTGEDALGILASKTSRYYPNAIISDVTIDSLMLNSVTQPLNIKGRVD